MIKAIIFDLDDTLYREYDYVLSGFRTVADFLMNKYGIEKAYEKLLKLFSLDKNNVYDRLLKDENIVFSDDDISDIAAVYRNHYPRISLPPDIVSTLKILRHGKYKIGLITDGRSIQQAQKIKALQLHEYMDEIIVTDALGGVGYRKPNPASFILMAQRLYVDISNLLYIGDNPRKDFAVKQYIPITTVRFMSNGFYAKEDYLDNVEPDYIIDNIASIFDILKLLDYSV